MRFFSLFAMTALFAFSQAKAYTITSTDSGQLIRWRYGQKLFLAGNPTGQDHLPADFFSQTVVNALQQWKWATAGQFDFEYWQGTDEATYTTGLKQDGLTSIFFASNSTETTDPNVIGFTQVWYNNTTGDLVEADVMLNDKNYQLTTNPTDTSSKGSSSYRSRPKVYVGNIITHELGHAIGLSHSGNINSSMLYVEFSEQSKIGCDDWSAARHLYPVSNGGTGALTGTVLSPSSEPISGAVVTAISKSRGTVLATVLTDQSGVYYFGALETGDTSLMIQPFQGSASSIPARVQAKTTQNVCGTSGYPTNFITSGDGHTLQDFYVSSGGVSDVGVFRLNCDEVSNSGSLFAEQAAPEMLVDRGVVGASQTYQFNANGAFSISGLGYLLLSPVKVDISVTDEQGQAVAIQTLSPLYQSTSNFVIPDTHITGTAQGLVNVKVTPSSIAYSDYPTPSVWPSTVPYYVITFNSGGNSASAVPDARCSPPATFAKYQSPSGDPVRFASTTGTRDSVGFCGGNSAQADSLHGKSRPHRETPLGSIVGWLFPFWVAFATYFYSKARRRRLASKAVV